MSTAYDPVSSEVVRKRERGVVRWFDQPKGYGFIEFNGVDVFAHYTAINGDGFRFLVEGQTVEFFLEKGLKGGFKAVGIETIQDPVVKMHQDTPVYFKDPMTVAAEKTLSEMTEVLVTQTEEKIDEARVDGKVKRKKKRLAGVRGKDGGNKTPRLRSKVRVAKGSKVASDARRTHVGTGVQLRKHNLGIKAKKLVVGSGSGPEVVHKPKLEKGAVVPAAAVEVRHKPLCAYCRIRPGDTVEHLIPFSSGLAVAHAPINKIPVCRECNEGKGGRWPTKGEADALVLHWRLELGRLEDALRIADAIQKNAQGQLPASGYKRLGGKKRRRGGRK